MLRVDFINYILHYDKSNIQSNALLRYHITLTFGFIELNLLITFR